MSETSSKRVLLIDDDSQVVDAVSFLLSTLDFEVDAFFNGRVALEELPNTWQQYDCAFVDLAMPVIDGLETLKLVREFATEFHVVLTTGYTDRHVPESVLEDPYTHFLKKPFSYEKLSDCLQQFLPADSLE